MKFRIRSYLKIHEKIHYIFHYDLLVVFWSLNFEISNILYVDKLLNCIAARLIWFHLLLQMLAYPISYLIFSVRSKSQIK